VSELRVGFHRQMEVLEAMVMQLFATVSEDLERATQALLDGTDALDVVMERERFVDALVAEVEALATRQFARQAPVATDLRFLLSVLRVGPELERSHDLVVHLAREANHLDGGNLPPRIRGMIQQMGDVSSDMWRTAADAWYERDGSAVVTLEARDDDLDALRYACKAQLALGDVSLPGTMRMILVGRFYERLGDHAVNVAARVAYLTGRPVR
jgi:phosphate transport system protein